MKTKENSPANGANLRKYSPAEPQSRREIPVGQASRLPSTQGRDGSPQPSQVSGADVPSWPFKLQVSGLNSPVPPLRASAPPREISPLRSQVSAFRFQASAFTLLEVLVATAVLALMMTFLFNLLGSSAKIWEIGNKKIEAAQAARVGLNIMAADLKNAFAGNMTSYTTNGTAIQNIAPFYAVDSPSNAIDVAAAGQPVNTDGSQQVFGVLSSSDSSLPYKEFGFLCVFLKNKDGTDPMIGHRYYLLRKLSNTGSSSADFFLRTAGTDWAGTTSTSGFNPIIDNCIRLKLAYFGNTSSATGTPTLTTAWSPQDRLPLGVLVTISVLDTKTAEKIAAINAGTPLTDLQISNGLSSSPPSDLTTVERLIAQGSVTMSRFIPFNAN